MPIYEYQCRGCDHLFESLVLSSEDPVPACPQCGGGEVQKLMSAGSVRPQGIPTGSGGFKPPACKASGGCGR